MELTENLEETVNSGISKDIVEKIENIKEEIKLSMENFSSAISEFKLIYKEYLELREKMTDTVLKEKMKDTLNKVINDGI